MEVSAFTEQVADLSIRYQIIFMKDSAMIWVQTAAEETIGSLTSLAVSMPKIIGGDTLPPATTVVGGDADATSQNIAQKLSRRCGIAVWACVDLPEEAAVIEELVMRRILQAFSEKGYGTNITDGSTSSSTS